MERLAGFCWKCEILFVLDIISSPPHKMTIPLMFLFDLYWICKTVTLTAVVPVSILNLWIIMLFEGLLNPISNCLFYNLCIFNILNGVKLMRIHIFRNNWLLVLFSRDLNSKDLIMTINIPTVPSFNAGSTCIGGIGKKII